MAERKRSESGQEPERELIGESEHERFHESRLRSRQTAGRQAEELTLIAEIGRVIGSSLDMGEVYERFAAEAKKLIPFDRLSVNPMSAHDNAITVAYVSGCDIPGQRPGDTAPLRGTFTEIVLRTRKSLLINTESVEEVTSRFPGVTTLGAVSAGMRSIIYVPLISRGEIIGILHFQSRIFNAYSERELRLAEKIGTQIAGAIANMRLFADLKKAETQERINRENAERLAEEMAVIAEIGRVIGSSLEIDEVYERFAAEVRKLIPFDRIHVNLKDPDGESFTIVYVSGLDIAGRRPGDKVPLAGLISEAVIRTRTGLLLHPMSEDEILVRFPGAFNANSFREGMRSIMCIPLISRDEAIGVLHFRSKTPNAYTEHNLHLSERIGAQIAEAIANAQLYSGLKQAEEALRRSEQQLKSYIESVGDAIYVLKTDNGRILDCNSRACRDLGYSKDELLKLSAKDIECRLSSEEIDAFHSDLKPGEVKMFEGLHKRKDGSIFPVEIRLSSLSPSQPELLISIVRDTTDRKQAEEELERYRMHLEEMVKERTEELEIKNITLQELNTTLKVLLKQKEDDKKDMEERFVMNVRNLVLPFVEQMKRGRLDVGQEPCLDIIETHLNDIASPLLKNIRQFYLTPKEIKVAALVKDGKSTKEIAKILGIATGSIDIHRNNIRKKLGLSSRKANLQSHLQTLDH